MWGCPFVYCVHVSECECVCVCVCVYKLARALNQVRVVFEKMY